MARPKMFTAEAVASLNRRVAPRKRPTLRSVKCGVCGASVTIRGKRRPTICDDCAVCSCGSGRPPGVCHGRSRSGFFVALVR